MQPGNEGKSSWWNSLLLLLSKLGILRSGTKSYTYTSGRDRPAESLMNDVFDAERDLTTEEDIARRLRRGREK